MVYVYCITDRIYTPGMEQKGIRCLFFNDLYAVVKDVSPEEFSEENLKRNFASLEWIEAHTREHIGVICEVMKSCSVIPFKFGAIFNSEENIGKFIDEYAASLSENLNRVKGNEEWSVKIFCNHEVIDSQIEVLSEEVRGIEAQIKESTPGRAFILKRKRAELVTNEVERVIRGAGQHCFDSLERYSGQTHLCNLLPRELTERNDDMILNATYFVKEESVPEFLKTADNLLDEYKKIGFELEVTGPWPPFTFVTLKEK